MTRNVVIGAVLGLAVALLLSPVIVIFQDQMGQLLMATAGGILAWLLELRGTRTRQPRPDRSARSPARRDAPGAQRTHSSYHGGEGGGQMDGWRVKDRGEEGPEVSHRHGLLWIRAEVLADGTGGHWAKCPRCGDSVQVHHEHGGPVVRQRPL